ncbi:iron ABC transporter permease [Clostridium botulinum]|uniref:Iron ABC transporter permease n=1 Tax=Clostridium botulinum TaxID=1491 RepID=A0A0M1M6E0_CLOBO|nr:MULTISPECIES: iron chelate uptake ABC transporter family permease subunit [Clostridium]ACD53776.1 iron chelate uptake ABC transporter, FeCT family, permease protein [Clostridium botulinum E3 str. Alaska E43]AJF28639.1 iron ABC transporter [Clostridium botulinum]AJF31700.1 iron ABC transporter [Clostridium botulinum]KAI3349725.1 iron ABC transporter permease [Clostridium botulinum]KOM87364.1 iron ABC transporter [Clostridium botulinum]
MNLKYSKVISSIVLLLLIIISLLIGRYNIKPIDIINTMLHGQSNSLEFNLIWNIRFSRVVLVSISGAALSLSGIVYQSIFQNPIVSADVLGVSSGASLGAAIAIVFLPFSPIIIQVMAFAFGIGAVVFSLLLSRQMRSNRILALIIAGIVTGAISSSFLMIIKYLADPYKELPSIDFWLMGGFYNSTWNNVVYVFILTTISAVILFLLRWKLKVLTMGDDQAKLLGVNVKVIRIIAIFSATLLVSTVVSVAGIISWIGLLAPHIVKFYAKDDISEVMGLTMVVGAIILIIADTIARSLTSVEIPVSILTSLVGAPFLVYILNRKENTIR